MEALDLALGLGMPGRPVLLPGAEVGEQVLEGVVTTGEARGVDGTVVGMRRIVEVEGGVEPFPLEVPGDRHRSAIEPPGGEFGVQGDDPLPHVIRCPARVAPWSP